MLSRNNNKLQLLLLLGTPRAGDIYQLLHGRLQQAHRSASLRSAAVAPQQHDRCKHFTAAVGG